MLEVDKKVISMNMVKVKVKVKVEKFVHIVANQ